MTTKTLRKLGSYSLLEMLGRGTMGVVYRAHDSARDQYVALKTMDLQSENDSNMKESFYREARLAASLTHPHIVRILNVGEENNEVFLAMELLEGKDLKKLLKEGIDVPLSEKVRWMMELCEAISYAHQSGIIHRDIKPGNLFICNDSRIVVMDFGIARNSSAIVTRPGAVMGTPDYISPEQVLAIRSDHRADIFSMGIVFYELLTSRHPFRGRNLSGTIHRILNETPRDPQDWNPEISGALGRIVLRAVERDVNARFRNCEEMLTALKEV